MAKKSLRERGRAIGRSIASGFKGTLVAGGTGGGSYFLHRVATENIDMLNQPGRGWIGPAALLIAGHAMKQRRSLMVPGIATCGAAGYALVQGIDFQMKINKANAAGGTTETKGLVQQGDVGTVVDTGDVNEALPYGSGAGFDYESPAPSEARALGMF
jgi:hypothetical protein